MSKFSVIYFTIFWLILNWNACRVLATYRPSPHTLAKYVVFLNQRHQKFPGDHQYCGGVILTAKKILTAGHCLINSKTLKLKDKKNLYVVAGSPERLYAGVQSAQVRRVDKMILHEDFIYNIAFADIGLIILSEPIKKSDYVKSISLPMSAPVVGEQCTILGWGRVYASGPNPNEVLYSDLLIVNNSFCSIPHHSPGMLCAGNPFHGWNDACEGDSGGPLICNETLYGLVSYGAGCGVPFYSGVYTDVWYYKKWIETNGARMKLKALGSLLLLVMLVLIL